ncbi:Ni/Fe hydrogenase subunit alpha [candidate division KSB1 bacterium]
MKKITIDPITRLEGHGKIEIFLNDEGNVSRAAIQIPELRGFERFCLGRPAEEMPRITQRICGVCPTAHHMASTKALDKLWKVEPTPTAKKIRELIYNTFYVEDHALHFYFLGGPDFVVGPDAPAEKRNILGVIEKVGLEIGAHVIDMRKRLREVISLLGGKVVHPVFGLPGGVSRGLSEDERKNIEKVAKDAVEFGKFSLKIFEDVVLKNKTYVDIITGDGYIHKTYYMGLVDENNKVNYYDGQLRVVDPDGKEFAKFPDSDYLNHIAERVEPWSYIKFNYLKDVGWKGFTDGMDSGIYRVAPLGRLNASEGMSTPLAQKEFDKMYEILGGKPVHFTLAFHWARLIELLNAAENMLELARDKEITGKEFRNIPTETPEEGIGVVEAPRGTLIHHYKTDENGLLTAVNLIVATQNNSAPFYMSVDKAAKTFIKNGVVNDGLLNMVEIAFRAYDPCMACATHSISKGIPLIVDIMDSGGKLYKRLSK